MEKKKIDRVIEAFRNYRNLREDGMGVSAVGPTNKVGDGEKSLGYNIQTGTPPVDLRKKKNRNWNPFFKNLARIEKRSAPK